MSPKVMNESLELFGLGVEIATGVYEHCQFSLCYVSQRFRGEA
jgi:hypothetical protein